MPSATASVRTLYSAPVYSGALGWSGIESRSETPGSVRKNAAAKTNSPQNTAMAADREVVLTTCPRDCYDACGIRVVKRNGAITAVRGDPAHAVARGWLCPKCATGYNGSWRDETKRLTRPLRRSGKRGSGSFTRITWEG